MCSEIRNFRQFMAELEQLSQLAEQGLLTATDLALKMALYYDDGDYIPQSVGTAWIIKNPAEFGEMLSGARGERRGQAVDVFLREFFDTPHVIERLLCSADVLGELSHWYQKAEFVRDAYIHCGARNNGWIRAAREIGVSDDILRGAVLERLRRTERVQPMRVNEATNFVGGGAGEMVQPCGNDFLDVNGWCFADKNSPWSLFPGNTIEEALLLCADKAPKETLQQARTIAARLGGWLPAHTVLTRAIANLTSVLHLDPRVLALFPGPSMRLGFRLEYEGGNDTEVTVKFLTQTYLALEDPYDRPKLFYEQAMRPILDRVSVPVLYRNTRGFALDTRMTKYVNGRMREEGYVIGIVRESGYTDRWGRQRHQWYVDVGQSRYVQDYNQHRHSARVGGRVMVGTKGAQWLARRNGRTLYRVCFHTLPA